MIVTISPETKYNLAVEGGLTADTLHITLAYIEKDKGSVMEQYAKTLESCLYISKKYSPFELRLTEVARFENVTKMTDSEGNVCDATVPTDVVFLKGESDHLILLRQDLVDFMESIGCSYSKRFKDFKPHLSLKYVPHGEEFVCNYPLPHTVLIENIEVWTDTEKYKIPLKGTT